MIQITENDLRNIIRESIRNIIIEGFLCVQLVDGTRILDPSVSKYLKVLRIGN